MLYSRYFDKFLTSPFRLPPSNVTVVRAPVSKSVRLNIYWVIIPRRNGSGTGLQLMLTLVELVALAEIITGPPSGATTQQ